MKKNSISVREMALAALFTAITAVMAQIAIPIPISPVPISFGMVAIYAAGVLLSPRAAALSQIVYLLLGACGAPVFHNFTGGAGILFGPTGGYLFAYPLVALLISGYFLLAGRMGITKPAVYNGGAVIALILGLTLLYGVGTVWLSVYLNTTFGKALAVGVYPYVVLDAVKIVASTVILLPLRRRLAKQGLLLNKDHLHQQHI